MEKLEGSQVLPSEIDRFNWGAFLFNWIWGIMHGKYITLLYFPACLVPVVGPLLICIWFGICGNRWAWESRSWESVEKFNDCQKYWVRLWIVLFVLSIILLFKLFILLAALGSLKV